MPGDDGLIVTLRIPNREVASVYRTTFADVLARGAPGPDPVRTLVRAMLAGDVDELHGRTSTAAHGWISLSGTSYAADTGVPLSLAPHIYNYGNSYAPAAYHVARGIVCLSGLIRSKDSRTWGTIGTLPPNARPAAGHVVFELNAHAQNIRGDVLASGEITINAATGPIQHNWVSLSGVCFPTGE